MGIWIDLTQLTQIIASFLTIAAGIHVIANFVKAWWQRKDDAGDGDTK